MTRRASSVLVAELRVRAATLWADALRLQQQAYPLEPPECAGRRNRRKTYLADLAQKYERLAELAETEGL